MKNLILCLFSIINAWGTDCKTVFNPHLHQYTTPIINLRRNKVVQTNYKWEMGLKEAMYQALLKERYNFPNLREQLYASPIIGMHDAGTPFGDISTLAKGKLFITANGFQFVQQQSGYDNYQQGHSCHTYECRTSYSQHNSNLLALWTVRRIRHRDRYQGHIYEIEYAISPIIFNKGQEYASKHGELNDEIPKHVFVIKPSLKASNYQTDDVVKDKSQGYRHLLNGRLERGNGKPSIPFGINSYVTHDERPSYLPPTTPNYLHKHSGMNGDSVIDTYKKLLESLSAKTTGVTRLPMAESSIYPIPSPNVRHNSFMTSTPHLSIDATTERQMLSAKTTNTIGIDELLFSKQTVPMQPSTSYITVATDQNVRPIDKPVNDNQYFTHKTETTTKDVQLEKSSTSAREYVRKFTTPIQKIFFTKKATGVDNKTKFTAPKPKDDGEQTSLFRIHKPTQSMGVVKQTPLTTAQPVFTNGQMAAPTPNFTSTLPYPIHQTTWNMKQGMERVTTQQNLRTTPINILVPSPIPSEPITQSTTQTRKVRPTTLFEYFFETSPLPTTSSTRQSSHPPYITNTPNSTIMNLLVTNRMKSTNTELPRNTFPFLVTSGSKIDTTSQNTERKPIQDNGYTTRTAYQTAPTTFKLDSTSNQYEKTQFTTTQYTTGQVYNVVPTVSTIYREFTVPPHEQYSGGFNTQNYNKNQPTTNRFIKENVITTQETPSESTTNHFNTYRTTNTELQPVTMTQPAFYPVVTSYDQRNTLSEPTNIFVHIPTTPYFVATTRYPSTMTYQETYPTQFTTSPIYMTSLQPTDFRLSTLITIPSYEANQLATTTQPTYIITQPKPESTLTDSNFVNNAVTSITTPDFKTTQLIKTTQPTYVTRQPKPKPMLTDNFLADKEGTGQTSVNLHHPNDYSDDDIFGGPRKTSRITQKPTTHFTQSNLEETLFGTRPEVKYKSGNSKIRSLKAPKIIFSNFYKASTNPSVYQTTYFNSQLSNKMTDPNTTQRPSDNLLPLTQQSYSTSISFHVNKKNETSNIIDTLRKLEFEPTIKAEVEEIKHPDSKFTIYKAKMPPEKPPSPPPPPAREKTEYKGKFDMLALQLVNHAKSLDYINSRNNTKTNTRQRKYRRGNSSLKLNRRQQRSDVPVHK